MISFLPFFSLELFPQWIARCLMPYLMSYADAASFSAAATPNLQSIATLVDCRIVWFV